MAYHSVLFTFLELLNTLCIKIKKIKQYYLATTENYSLLL